MTFSTSQVAEAAKVSLRQLQWWDERRVVSSGIFGHAREWDANALFKVLIVAALRSKGVSLQRIRAVIRPLPIEKLRAQPDAVLVIRRKGMRICVEDAALTAAHEESGPVWIIVIAPILERLERALLMPVAKGQRVQ